MSRLALIEAIESRRMMTVIPVTTTTEFGPGSIRQAMHDAAAGDTIDMTGISGTITLQGGALGFGQTVTLLGPGAESLKIVGTGSDPVALCVNGTLTIKNVTLTGGESISSSGGGVFNRGALELDGVTVKNNHAYLFGGGVYSSGTSVTLNNCTFLNNTVSGALESSGGGVYMLGGTLTINNTTFTQNMAIGASNVGVTSGPGTGGGIYLHNTLASTVTNCTFGNNTAQGGTGGALAINGQGFGGAIYTDTANSTLLNHCTIAYNAAKGGGNALLNTLALSQGGGVYSATNTTGATLLDTIAALNTAANQPDVLNTLIGSLGNNIIGVYSGTLFNHTALGDMLGTTLQPYSPGISATLSANGGDTMTYALLSDSSAVNTGSAATSPALDQRGFGRRDTPDIGAFELNPNHLPEVAANAAIAVAGVAFSQPVAAVDADNDTLTITSTDKPDWISIQKLNGTWTLVGTPGELDAAAVSRFHLNVFDGYQTVTVGTSVKVAVPGIDLSPSGLLRVNGTEFDDVLSVTLLDDNTVRVFRDGFKRNYALADIRKVQVIGFAGNDAITVDIGKIRATVFAGDGNDTVQSGAGADYLSGGLGNDILYGGAGADRVNGDEGTDRVFGGAGNDTMHGGAGRDLINGGTGHNRLFGDNGNDTFFSLQGVRDIIDGGLGENDGQWASNATVIDAVLSQ